MRMDSSMGEHEDLSVANLAGFGGLDDGRDGDGDPFVGAGRVRL